jgi:hypothetical protein
MICNHISISKFIINKTLRILITAFLRWLILSNYPLYCLVHKVRLTQRQLLRRLRLTNHPIRFNSVRFWVNLHLGSRVIKLHVLFSNIAAVPHSLHALLQP